LWDTDLFVQYKILVWCFTRIHGGVSRWSTE